MDLEDLITRIEALLARSRSASSDVKEVAAASERGEISGLGPIISCPTERDADFNKIRDHVAAIERERPSDGSSVEPKASPNLPFLGMSYHSSEAHGTPMIGNRMRKITPRRQ
jgi:hypothetical protein